MNEKFIKSIYKTIVEEGRETYRDLYENTKVTEQTVDYWKRALELYHSFDNIEKKVFIDIIEQTIIDTLSSVLGVLDGSSSLDGINFEFDVKINGVSTEDELQDVFLGFIEESNT